MYRLPALETVDCMQAGGVTTDHDSYLAAPGSADVLFPTNFAQLGRLYARACAQHCGPGALLEANQEA